MSGSEFYVGVMSGTSLDGVDAALVEFAEDGILSINAIHYQPYPQPLKERLLALHLPTNDELHQASLLGNELASHYASAVSALLRTAGIHLAEVRALGCHGQTVRHRPDAGYTVQIGNAARLAELSGITVVSDFRSRDLAAGGQGAPLVPAFHDRLLRHPSIHRVIVNIGGISNLTDLAPEKITTGFDCGPGNLLMDAWCAEHLGQPYDEDGAWASTGRVLPTLLDTLLNEPFFALPPPKSSGRDLFNLGWLQDKLRGDERPEDVQATLLALTSRTIAQAILDFCPGAQEIYLCGGGAHNRELVSQLAQSLPDCAIKPTDDLGIAADWMEAVAFAWLARQTMHGETANLPAVTGARHECILGAIYPA
ncbi:MAG: anhydro-N-acetylmuramic acid kinase [Gallionellaceae bacterium]|jgi:anhydro-N-acetylmuramic acid kinase|nr:anhydro-N-acetylmuramic acid kinase [Gallionellaceae bacterium]